MKVVYIKLKGTTLVEVLIAMVIAGFCAALASVIYLNVQKSSVPFFKLKALEAAGYYMDKCLREKTFYEETLKAEEFTVRRLIERNELFNDCYQLRIAVFDQAGKKLVELESAINNPR